MVVKLKQKDSILDDKLPWFKFLMEFNKSFRLLHKSMCSFVWMVWGRTQLTHCTLPTHGSQLLRCCCTFAHESILFIQFGCVRSHLNVVTALLCFIDLMHTIYVKSVGNILTPFSIGNIERCAKRCWGNNKICSNSISWKSCVSENVRFPSKMWILQIQERVIGFVSVSQHVYKVVLLSFNIVRISSFGASK